MASLPGMVAICKEIMTPQGFRRMYYTGERFGGPEAMALGFADAVYAADELLPRSIEFAATLAAKRTRTYAEMKLRNRAEVARILDEEDPGAFLSTLRFAIPMG